MATRRQRKVADLLHKEISELIQYQTHDPRLGFVTVTGVDISPDLRRARVYVTVLGDEGDTKETLAGLASATGYFRHRLGQTLSLRRVPELIFELDNSLAYGLHIDSLLEQIKEEESGSSEGATEPETNE